MKRRLGACLALAAVVYITIGDSVSAKDVPYLAGRVNDHANLLPQPDRDRIEGKLRSFEQQAGAQVVVLTIDSLEGEALDAYSVRVAHTWKLGQKDADNGVLFLVAKQDRKMRIEVGYGLEAKLTDAQSVRILDNLVRPRFRQGDFVGGIEAGVDAILGTVRGEDVIPSGPPPSSSRDASEAGWGFKLVFFGFYAVVTGVFSALALFSRGRESWVLWLFLMPFHLLFPMVLHPLAGLIIFGAWLLGLPLFKLWFGKSAWGRRFGGEHPGWASFASAGGSGESGGWSSGGDSGFSGGGGDFGGGGASSDW